MAYKKILVGIDGSAQSDKAFETASALATALSASLSLIWVVNRDRGMDSSFGVSEDFYQDQYHQVKDKLAPYIEKAKKLNIDVTGEALIGNVKLILARDYPAEHGIDLIVLGNTGLNAIEKLVIGSHTSYVIRNSAVDVLIVK
ncbi:universal stress protein [Oenococcus sicerae]|uniref:Universal stress protein n=1 Tax=Oenococcus sicerae TaxID=2203724 RepID=A0AAJ1VN81_9LACO|nr:universal stress protein [Oenococcus sicerae]MDN6899914.1 universal stress protein [Oenococcus sicerae]